MADSADHIVGDAGRGERRSGFRHTVTLNHRQADTVEEMRQRHVQRSTTACHVADARAESATHGTVYGSLIRKMLRDLLGGRAFAGLLHARPIACGFGSLEEQASLPTRAGLAGGRVIHLLEHSWYAQQICRFEGTQIGQQRLCVRQITNHAVVGSNRRVLDEPCETVGERQEEKQSRMIFENDLMQRQTACARDRYEIAVRKLGTLWSSRRTGRVHDGGQIVCMHRIDARFQLLVGHGDAQAFQRAHGVGIEHQNVLERRAAVDYGVETVEALAIVGDGQFHIRIVEDTLGLRRGISVVDRHVHRADGGQCEVEHAPLVAGGGEDGDGIALVDAECDEAFCGGEHGIVEFAGSDLRPLAGGGFVFRDHGIFASARYASSKQGIDGFVVAHLNGFARGGVLGEHEAFSFSRFLRCFRVFLLVMRAGAIQTVCPRFLPLAHLAHSKLRGRKSAL